jgi:hypothetical protein
MKAKIFVMLQFFVDLQNALNFFLFRCNHAFQNGNIVLVKVLEVGFPLKVSLSFFCKLVIVEGC